MRFLGTLSVLSLAAASLSAEVILTMKSGERYELPQAPKHKNGMVSFTTRDKRFLTVKEAEVAKEENYVPPTPKKKLDRTDTKQLGAIAREQRAERGVGADVAGTSGTGKNDKTPKTEKKDGRKSKKKSPQPPPPPVSSDPH